MKHGHVTGTKRERRGASDWCKQIEDVVDEELWLRHAYLMAENRMLRQQSTDRFYRKQSAPCSWMAILASVEIPPAPLSPPRRAVE